MSATACSDPTGYAGVLTIDSSNTLSCQTTKIVHKKSNNLFAKIVREIVRTPDNAINILTKVGNAGSDLMCDVVQKEKGKNCNVNVRFGTTFDIPESDASDVTSTPSEPDAIRTRTAAATYERLLARDPLIESNRWAQAAAELYSLCVQSCTNPAYRSYALLQLQDLETIVNSSASDDIKGRYITSLSRDMGDFAEKLADSLPVISTAYRWYKAGKMSDIVFYSKWAILDLPPPKNIEEDIRRRQVWDDLTDLGIRNVIIEQMVPIALDGWIDAYSAMLPKVQGLNAQSQYQILMKLGLDTAKFVERHNGLTNADDFLRAAISDALQPIQMATSAGPK